MTKWATLVVEKKHWKYTLKKQLLIVMSRGVKSWENSLDWKQLFIIFGFYSYVLFEEVKRINFAEKR